MPLEKLADGLWRENHACQAQGKVCAGVLTSGEGTELLLRFGRIAARADAGANLYKQPRVHHAIYS
jgi:hypothetical protein